MTTLLGIVLRVGLPAAGVGGRPIRPLARTATCPARSARPRQYAGYGVRSFEAVSARMQGPGAHERLVSLTARESLRRSQQLSAEATALYDDGELAPFRLGDG